MELPDRLHCDIWAIALGAFKGDFDEALRYVLNIGLEAMAADGALEKYRSHFHDCMALKKQEDQASDGVNN